MKEEYIMIQSNQTIQVTCSLGGSDETNPDAHVPDRLKVSSLWPKAMIIIHQGQHTYPAEIATWPTVKALEKDKVLTIGSKVTADEATDEAKQNKERLLEALDEIKQLNNIPLTKAEENNKRKVKEVKALNLEDISEGE